MSVTPAARVLVVEDEEEVAISLQRLLTAEGYEVEHASGVSEALAKIEQSSSTWRCSTCS
jgi:CheY-like chemotaxis protein